MDRRWRTAARPTSQSPEMVRESADGFPRRPLSAPTVQVVPSLHVIEVDVASSCTDAEEVVVELERPYAWQSERERERERDRETMYEVTQH